MALIQSKLANNLLVWLQTKHTTKVDSAMSFMNAYVNYAYDASAVPVPIVTPGSLDPAILLSSVIISSVQDLPILGPYYMAMDSAIVSLWGTSSTIAFPGSLTCLPADPGVAGIQLIAEVIPAAYAGATLPQIANLMATILDAYTLSFIVTYATGNIADLN